MSDDRDTTIGDLRGFGVPLKSGTGRRVGPSEYRYSTERGQWLKVSGEGPEAVTPVRAGERPVCTAPFTLRNARFFKVGDEIWLESVTKEFIYFVPVGGVMTSSMPIDDVDRYWRSPPKKEQKTYAAPTITKLTAADVTRKLIADVHNKARNLDASVLLACDGRKLVTLHASTQPDPARIHDLTELLGPPIVIVAGADVPPRDPPERMTQLAETFPSLQGNRIPGVRPWEPVLLMRAGGLSHGELCSVRFVLWVWDPHKPDWPCGQFDLGDAIGVWDAPHRQAFTTWASKPWWP